MARKALPGPKRVKDTWAILPSVSERFNKEARAESMMPNELLESLMLLWLDYLLPKSKEGE